MEKLTIRVIEDLLSKETDPSSAFFNSLLSDERKGVQQLVKKWYTKRAYEEKAQEKFMAMTYSEKKYRSQGYEYIAGIDEVGRGPLAGPVIAAAVILPKDFYLPGLDDSKKLSEQKRNEFYEYIISNAISVNVGIVNVDEIDRINIYEASKKAMLTAIAGLDRNPCFLLVDAVKLDTPYPQEAIIKGDSKSVSIAAASIVAKVTRDRMMVEIDKDYPSYGFKKNMGYGTKEHVYAIEKYGVTPHHRKSFSPVKDFLQLMMDS